VAPAAAAYLLYFRALRGASAGTAARASLIEPLTATGLAVAFLGDRLSPAGLAGAVLLLVTVLLAGAPPAWGPGRSAGRWNRHRPGPRRGGQPSSPAAR
jgi:drug/metabolite transporter, DME family